MPGMDDATLVDLLRDAIDAGQVADPEKAIADIEKLLNKNYVVTVPAPIWERLRSLPVHKEDYVGGDVVYLSDIENLAEQLENEAKKEH